MAKKNELAKKEEKRPVSFFDEMTKLFERFPSHPFSMMTHPTMWSGGPFSKMADISPSVDIFEEDDTIVVKADIPGISKEDLNVSINDSILTLSGEKKQEEKIEKKNYHRVERSYGSFSRSFQLPGAVNSDQVKASFKKGVLEIRIPKTGDNKRKKISIT
ncbi:molecular chaperone (small heat shock protein) [Desulfocapsa sulfexigens DSM 10523]|uniref:Molecular chaperone (Small heat shock protein) n=1 Tax=Desulfocapsa sulfexigens (strain DSM 10523 / SB164P1) TaxID=1167006 RepID=M1P637_DESSD|nr:Hsp20/alpha crystallin family protein [Desulfocapsa sulfexigens]AGF77152.1 molecular chaperone (small heat shock protein) [Desulfocapsa sulfexigens DSM 10523]